MTARTLAESLATRKVVLASANRGKLNELETLLAPLGLTLETLAQHHVGEERAGEEEGHGQVMEVVVQHDQERFDQGSPPPPASGEPTTWSRRSMSKT